MGPPGHPRLQLPDTLAASGSASGEGAGTFALQLSSGKGEGRGRLVETYPGGMESSLRPFQGLSMEVFVQD